MLDYVRKPTLKHKVNNLAIRVKSLLMILVL